MSERRDRRSERIESLRLDGIKSAFLDHERALPIVASVEHDERATFFQIAKRLLVVLTSTTDAEPEHIYRHSQLFHVEFSLLAHGRMPAVGSHDERGVYFEF